MDKKTLFEYRVPDYSDFQSDLNDDADSIFHAIPTNDDGSVPAELPCRIKQERISVEPCETFVNFGDMMADVVPKKEVDSVIRPMRRSLSANHIPDIDQVQRGLDTLNIGSNLSYMKQKSTENIYRKYGSKENVWPKRENSNESNIINEKYISMAEKIYHMENDTPKRFRTAMTKLDPKLLEVAKNRKRAQLVCRSTIPQSPALLSKTRVRPVTALSREQLEQIEWDEIRKFHIKANPIPKCVLAGTSNLAPVQRKPPTKLEPFNITELKKTRIPQPLTKFQFTAKPVPTAILEGTVGLGKKTIRHVTMPITPKFMKSRSFDQKKHCSYQDESEKMKYCRSDKSSISESSNNTSTFSKFPEPFSFAERDKAMLAKKEAKIKHILEQEKRLREFKAHPIPTAIKKMITHASPLKLRENKENVCDVNKKPAKFEAKPPVVLYKPPFKPIKKEAPLTSVCPFNLHMEKRLAERQLFDQKIREQELLNEERQKKEEEEKQEAEQKEIAKLRSELVHQANPIRHYHPVKAVKELAITYPVTPIFQYKKKQKN